MLFNGTYANQPKDAAPCGVIKPAIATNEPNRKNQKAKAFSRGNATSGAPICSGISTLANPVKSGVPNMSSISVPCIVKSWLNCSLVCRICIPGSKSSMRISSAIVPPMQKKIKAAIRYIYPMVLWSVEVIQLTKMRPLDFGTTRGATVVALSVEYSRVVTVHLIYLSAGRGVAFWLGLRLYSSPTTPWFSGFCFKDSMYLS